jgi:hypothetical protein
MNCATSGNAPIRNGQAHFSLALWKWWTLCKRGGESPSPFQITQTFETICPFESFVHTHVATSSQKKTARAAKITHRFKSKRMQNAGNNRRTSQRLQRGANYTICDGGAKRAKNI